MLTSGSYMSPSVSYQSPAGLEHAGSPYYMPAPAGSSYETLMAPSYNQPTFDLSSSPSSSLGYHQSPFASDNSRVFKMQSPVRQSGDTSGHYSDFYSSQGMSSPEFQAPYQTFKFSSNDQQPIGAGNSQTYSPADSSVSSQQQQQQNYADQLVPSSSIENPTYLIRQPPIVIAAPKVRFSPAPKPVSSGNSRRSGSVTLKMDEATRAKVNKYYLEERQRANKANEGLSAEFRTRQQQPTFVPVSVANSRNLQESPISSLAGQQESGKQSNQFPSPKSVRQDNDEVFSPKQQGQVASSLVRPKQVTFMYIRPNTNHRPSTTSELIEKSESMTSAKSEPSLQSVSMSRQFEDNFQKTQSSWLTLRDPAGDKTNDDDDPRQQQQQRQQPPLKNSKPLFRLASPSRKVNQHHQQQDEGENFIAEPTLASTSLQSTVDKNNNNNRATLEQRWQQVAQLTASGGQATNGRDNAAAVGSVLKSPVSPFEADKSGGGQEIAPVKQRTALEEGLELRKKQQQQNQQAAGGKGSLLIAANEDPSMETADVVPSSAAETGNVDANVEESALVVTQTDAAAAAATTKPVNNDYANNDKQASNQQQQQGEGA